MNAPHDPVEDALRRMMLERSQDIATAPTWLQTLDRPVAAPASEVGVEDEILDLGRARSASLARSVPSAVGRRVSRRTWLLVAAAAVVALIGVASALVVALPATPNRAAGPSTVTLGVCHRPVPASWASIARRATFQPRGASGVSVVAVTPSGGQVLTSTTGAAAPSSLVETVSYLAPGSSAVRTLASFPSAPAGAHRLSSMSLDVSADDSVALVTVSTGARSVTAQQIVALPLSGGPRFTVTTNADYRAQHQHLVGRAYLHDGLAYWETDSEEPHGLSELWSATTVAGRPPGRVATGDFDLQGSAAGVTWALDGSLDRPDRLPPPVARAQTPTTDLFGSYVSDGRSWAWETPDGTLEWFGPAANQVRRFPLLLGRPFTGDNQAAVLGIAGRLVLLQSSDGLSDEVLDTADGALMPYPGAGSMLGDRGVVFGDPGALAPGTGGLLRLSTARLPVARC